MTSMTLGGALTNLPVEVTEHMSGIMLTRIPEQAESLLEVSYCIGSAIGCFLSPIISRKLGYPRSLQVLFWLAALWTLLTPIPFHWVYTVIIRVLTGLCASACASITPLVVAETLNPEQRGQTMTLYSVCLNIGVLFSYASNYVASFNYHFYYATFVPAIATAIAGAILSQRLKKLQRHPRRLPQRLANAENESDESSSEMENAYGQMHDRSDTFVRTVDEESTQAFEERAQRFGKRQNIQARKKAFRVGARHGNVYLGRQYSTIDHSDRDFGTSSRFNSPQNKSKRSSVLRSQLSYYQSTNDSIDASSAQLQGRPMPADVKETRKKIKKRLVIPRMIPRQRKLQQQSSPLQSINESGPLDSQQIDIAITDSNEISTLGNTDAYQGSENTNLSMKLTKSQYAKMCYISCALGAMQMFTGVDAIAIFASEIFGGLFPQLKNSGALGALILGLCNIFFTATAALFVERVKRRIVLMIGVLGCGCSTIAVAFIYVYNGPQWLILTLLLVFNWFYAMGPEPIVFMLLSEIFPTKYKDRLNAMAYVVDWVSNILSVYMFGLATSYKLQWIAYICFGILTLVLGVSATIMVPETFRRSLIDIEREIRSWTRKRRQKSKQKAQNNIAEQMY